jgi:hypothetical protein
MDCDTLKRQIKNWYLQVQDESLAPARMVMFMRDHAGNCPTCLADPMVNHEIDRIIKRYLPEDKIPEELRVHDRASLSMAALAAINTPEDEPGEKNGG